MSRLDEPLPYYKWLWRDFRASRQVQRMNYIERGLYRELLDECWSVGCIPDDHEQIADICGCPVEVIANAWQKLSKCFVWSDGVGINEKLESLRTASDSARVARANAGKKGGLARSKASDGADGPSKCKANAKQELSNCHIAEQEQSNSRADEEQSRAEQRDLASPARVVFGHWQKVMNSPRSAFDAKRKRLIEARLKDGYTENDLCNAITGCAASAWHMGDNDKGTKYNGLDLILRNSEKVDQFIGYYHNPPKQRQGKFNPGEYVNCGQYEQGEAGNGRTFDHE